MPPTSHSPPSWRTIGRETLWLVAGWFLFYTLCNSGHDVSEGLLAFKVARHWVRTGTLGLSEPDDAFGYLCLEGANGLYYSAHELGNTLAFLPFASLISVTESLASHFLPPDALMGFVRIQTAMVPSFWAAIGLGLFHAAGRRLYQLTPGQSLLGSFGPGIASFYWTYSQSHSDVLLTGILLMGSILGCFEYRRRPAPLPLLLGMASLGAAIITRMPSVLLLPPLAVYVATTPGLPTANRIRHGLGAAAMLLPFALWQMAYNHLRTGSVWTGGVHHPSFAENNAMDGDLAHGMAGLLFSPGRSVFVYSPLWVASLLCLPHEWRRRRADTLVLGTLFILWLVLHARLRAWHGVTGFGPRYFLSLVLVLSLPWLASIPRLEKHRALSGLSLLAALWGVVLGSASTISSWFYRWGYLAENPAVREPATPWTHTFTADILASAFRNIQRWFMSGPAPDVWLKASPSHVDAANTLDVWLVVATHQGLPWGWATLIAALLFAGSLVCWRRVLVTRHTLNPGDPYPEHPHKSGRHGHCGHTPDHGRGQEPTSVSPR